MTKFDIKSLKTKTGKAAQIVRSHGLPIVVLMMLVVYLFTIWRVSQLAQAEPDTTDQTTKGSIPRVDEEAIQKVLKLEQTSAEIQSLFNAARNNPFSE
ncbi:MAG: hypothetical protein WD877_00180 [Candidatus Saccharimonadales bacterium]